jgi:E3 ubiquitin-protein ligase MARCH6
VEGLNGTNSQQNDTVVLYSSNSTLITLSGYSDWSNISADVFRGQVIAAGMIAAFAAIFLLREWIMQYANPAIFDEDVVNDDEAIRPREDELPAIAPVVVAPGDHPDEDRLEEPDHEEYFINRPESPPKPAAADDVDQPEERITSRVESPWSLLGTESPPPLEETTDPEQNGHSFYHSSQSSTSTSVATEINLTSHTVFDFETHQLPGPSTATSIEVGYTDESASKVEDTRPRPGAQRRSSSEPRTIGASKPELQEYPSRAPLPRSVTPRDPQISESERQRARSTEPPRQFPNFPKRPPLPASTVPSPLATPSTPSAADPFPSPSLATYRAPEELGPGMDPELIEAAEAAASMSTRQWFDRDGNPVEPPRHVDFAVVNYEDLPPIPPHLSNAFRRELDDSTDDEETDSSENRNEEILAQRIRGEADIPAFVNDWDLFLDELDGDGQDMGDLGVNALGAAAADDAQEELIPGGPEGAPLDLMANQEIEAEGDLEGIMEGAFFFLSLLVSAGTHSYIQQSVFADL